MYNFLRTLRNSSYESPRGEDSESPLKSCKMFPYAQVIGRWKKYFFLESSRRRFFLNAIIQPVGRTSSRGNTACRFVCSGFARGYIFCMEIKSSVDQCVWMLISGLEPAKITLWASANVPSSQARVTSQKSLRSMRCNKEATVLAYYSSGQNESRSFQLRSLSFQHSELGEKALKSSAQCGEES